MEESIRPGGLNLPTCFTSSTGTVVASTNYPNADPMEDVEGDDEEEEDDDNDDSKDDDFNEESALGSSNRPSSMATAKASPATAKKWTPTEDSLLVDAVNRYGDHRWKDVARFVGTRNPAQCLQRWIRCLTPGLVKGRWSVEEDKKLSDMVCSYKDAETADWRYIVSCIPGRTSKQVRERWFNFLDPSLKRSTEWTQDEDEKLVYLVQMLGRKWSKIARQMPGRTENVVKVRYNGFLRKQRQEEKIRQKQRMVTTMKGLRGPGFSAVISSNSGDDSSAIVDSVAKRQKLSNLSEDSPGTKSADAPFAGSVVPPVTIQNNSSLPQPSLQDLCAAVDQITNQKQQLASDPPVVISNITPIDMAHKVASVPPNSSALVSSDLTPPASVLIKSSDLPTKSAPAAAAVNSPTTVKSLVTSMVPTELSPLDNSVINRHQQAMVQSSATVPSLQSIYHMQQGQGSFGSITNSSFVQHPSVSLLSPSVLTSTNSSSIPFMSPQPSSVQPQQPSYPTQQQLTAQVEQLQRQIMQLQQMQQLQQIYTLQTQVRLQQQMLLLQSLPMSTTSTGTPILSGVDPTNVMATSFQGMPRMAYPMTSMNTINYPTTYEQYQQLYQRSQQGDGNNGGGSR